MNLNLYKYLEGRSLTDLGKMLSGDGSRESEEIAIQARNVAIDYATFNLTMNFTNAIARAFPFSLRATVHPKAGQIGISKGQASSVFPWNGVAVSQSCDEYDMWRVTKVVPYWRAAANRLTSPVYLNGLTYPFFYLHR